MFPSFVRIPFVSEGSVALPLHSRLAGSFVHSSAAREARWDRINPHSSSYMTFLALDELDIRN